MFIFNGLDNDRAAPPAASDPAKGTGDRRRSPHPALRYCGCGFSPRWWAHARRLARNCGTERNPSCCGNRICFGTGGTFGRLAPPVLDSRRYGACREWRTAWCRPLYFRPRARTTGDSERYASPRPAVGDGGNTALSCRECRNWRNARWRDRRSSGTATLTCRDEERCAGAAAACGTST
jgi:hypothetical protein